MCVFLICAIFRSLLLLGENQNKKYRVGDDRYERERERESKTRKNKQAIVNWFPPRKFQIGLLDLPICLMNLMQG